MKHLILILTLFAFPLSTNALAGSCGGDHTHTEDTKKDKRVGAQPVLLNSICTGMLHLAIRYLTMFFVTWSENYEDNRWDDTLFLGACKISLGCSYTRQLGN